MNKNSKTNIIKSLKIDLSIMSRNQAVAYCNEQHKNKSVIISISTPYGIYKNRPFKNEKNNVQEILSLEFADADKPNTRDVYGRITSEKELLSDKQAKYITEFVEKYKDYYIIIHCDAGISRSAAIGAAILKYYTGDDSEIFNSRRYMPNMWCYRKVLEAFN